MSHADADSGLAARVSNALENNGLEVWNPDRELFFGDNWGREVARALEESDAMVVLVTPATASSRWVKLAIGYALGAKNFSNRLIPVVVGDHDHSPINGMPWIVRKMPRFNLEDSDADQPNVESIANAIRAQV